MILAAEPLGQRELVEGARPVAGGVGELAELLVNPSAHPIARRAGERRVELALGRGVLVEGGQDRPVGVVPARLFSWRTRSIVVSEPCEPLFNRQPGVGRPARSQRGAARFEPEQAVAREPALQVRNHPQRIVVAVLPVVEQHEGEERVRLHVAREACRVFDHPQSALLAAAHPGEPRRQPQRQ